VGGSFCVDCQNAPEVLLPGTLKCIVSVASPDHQLTLLVLPVASGMGIGCVYSTSVLSGLVGVGSMLTRPLWPTK
jgi:hypothetical protein